MPSFYLKWYTRRNKNSSVGTLVTEWTLEAPDNVAAERLAKEQLAETEFNLPSDFALLRDENGAKVWDLFADG